MVGIASVVFEVKWLEKALAIGGLIASMYLAFGAGDWIARLGTMGVDATLLSVFSTIQGWVNYFEFGKWAMAAYSVWNTLAVIRAVDEGLSYTEALVEVAGEVTGSVIGGVTDVIGGVLGGVLDGVFGAVGKVVSGVFSSPIGLLLLGVGAYYVLSDDEEDSGTQRIELTQANPATLKSQG